MYVITHTKNYPVEYLKGKCILFGSVEITMFVI